jgi:endonuclease/exonuclease/phosphatase (EEP) superfamily protein YafD
VIAPWIWFLVRDTWAPFNAASVAMPAIAVLGGVVLVVGAALSRRRLPLVVAASMIAMTAVTVVVPMMPQTAIPITTPLTIASANVYSSNRTPRAAADALAATRADVLVAVETPPGFADLLAAAAGKSHPYEAVSAQIVVRSAFPVTVRTTPPGIGTDRVLVAAIRPPAVEPFTLFAVHLINPIEESSFTYQQGVIQHLDERALIQQRTGPVVIAGDLNLSDRTHGYRILSTNFRDAMRAGSWAGDTYVQGIWRFALLRIDHLFLSHAWCAEDPSRFEVPGSDHEGIRATIGPCLLSK